MPAGSRAARLRCGVAGRPIAHSLSPVLHRAAYDALGLDWAYDAHDVDEAALPAFLHGLGPNWRGLSLTMPLKHAVLKHCVKVSDLAQRVGVANTLVIDGAGRWSGHNTDVPGFIAAWREAGLVPPAAAGVDFGGWQAVVLGSGATARSAVAALALAGIFRLTVLARSLERAGPLQALMADLGVAGEVRPLSAELGASRAQAELVVSTVPLAAQPEILSTLAVRDLLDRGAGALFDVAYGPEPTGLVAAARAAGMRCGDGFGLLLHQAARQVELMTGCDAAPLEAMRVAGLAAMDARG